VSEPSGHTGSQGAQRWFAHGVVGEDVEEDD